MKRYSLFCNLIGLAYCETVVSRICTFCRMYRIGEHTWLRFRTHFRNSRHRQLGTGGGADHRHFALENTDIDLESV